MIVFRHMQGRDRPSNMAKRGGEGGGWKISKKLQKKGWNIFLDRYM